MGTLSEDLVKNISGAKNVLKDVDRLFFTSESAKVHKELRKPGKNDWLARHKEKEQSFYSFTESTGVILPTESYLVIQPVKFQNDGLEVPDLILSNLNDFASRFFQGRVDVKKYQTLKIDKRINPKSGNIQYNCRAILDQIHSWKNKELIIFYLAKPLEDNLHLSDSAFKKLPFTASEIRNRLKSGNYVNSGLASVQVGQQRQMWVFET